MSRVPRSRSTPSKKSRRRHSRSLSLPRDDEEYKLGDSIETPKSHSKTQKKAKEQNKGKLKLKLKKVTKTLWMEFTDVDVVEVKGRRCKNVPKKGQGDWRVNEGTLIDMDCFKPVVGCCGVVYEGNCGVRYIFDLKNYKACNLPTCKYRCFFRCKCNDDKVAMMNSLIKKMSTIL